MLSLTQIELRKVISQELADAGINRNTLVDIDVTIKTKE